MNVYDAEREYEEHIAAPSYNIPSAEIRKSGAQAIRHAIESRNAAANPFGGLYSMRVTSEMVKQIGDARFAWLQLIPQGHAVVICAKPNGGKTTIFTQAAADMAKDGYAVIYINADASASDIKEYAHHAIDYGYTLINPDISGQSNEQVVAELKFMASLEHDYSNTVLILDTLKKFTDMMAKSKGKVLYSILRALTSKGMTVIALAHTNKYDGEDGLPMYEGTADLRADCDDLIYLITTVRRLNNSSSKRDSFGQIPYLYN
ncbi:AAA family ATPase [Polynucleobacter asymbioticus]|jgi:hypothetical protein|uniref:AAA+ ATPase domain-containing protein n=1 Tax=Polynucleobacter asymbioticus TaxID=576611 RepID=A0AAC9IR07_9BURK|nr:AAA family ATPase [Polynucleobacter asymbioticus]APB98826.1 hypothetical protein A4F89_05535 [Polynucleobacter asymbioticus]APC01129.1 hypothetical protein AOC25_05630 [Polynucleobacter asymbioticus]